MHTNLFSIYLCRYFRILFFIIIIGRIVIDRSTLVFALVFASYFTVCLQLLLFKIVSSVCTVKACWVNLALIFCYTMSPHQRNYFRHLVCTSSLVSYRARNITCVISFAPYRLCHIVRVISLASYRVRHIV